MHYLVHPQIFIMSKELVIEKSVIINRPKHEVFNFIQFTRNQEKFSVWNLADPQKKTTTQGTDGQVGFIYSWESDKKNVGTGHQEIKNITPDTSVEYELRFEKPMKNTGSSKFILDSAGADHTKITWDFRGPIKFPMNLFAGVIEKALGKDIQKSLDNLKQLLEQQD